MKALIDGDIPRYAIGSVCQEVITDDFGDEQIVTAPEYIWKHNVDKFFSSVLYETRSTSCRVFLSGAGNFREGVATVKPYKGNRDGASKPLLHEAITTYMIDDWGAEIVQGMEADDALAVAQTADYNSCYKAYNGLTVEEKDISTLNTVICTIDKDLRMVAGLHYGWPVSDRIGERPVYLVDPIGSLSIVYDPVKVYKKTGLPKIKKVEGTGLTWFYCQLIVGDSTDNIPGLPGKGEAAAVEALDGLDTEEEMYKAVFALYEAKYADTALERLTEQAWLLWMVREVDEEGKPVMWRPPVVEK